ncbi:hypothetical protein KIL84_000568 [Mauremys mutica]|uniref:Uncharacterized protein n=1 Tax=Mauremys mutica TaxID=74926 RepID=A0A9D3WYC6_9SAUR|nr:hypothetical protein KIL84_000568 [Mauremys mutica]
MGGGVRHTHFPQSPAMTPQLRHSDHLPYQRPAVPSLPRLSAQGSSRNSLTLSPRPAEAPAGEPSQPLVAANISAAHFRGGRALPAHQRLRTPASRSTPGSSSGGGGGCEPWGMAQAGTRRSRLCAEARTAPTLLPPAQPPSSTAPGGERAGGADTPARRKMAAAGAL